MVGGGLEYQHYRNLVDKYDLSEYVRFTGSLKGTDIDDVYNVSDIAISSLGLYKLNIDYLSTLKDCEYLAKGLPIVLGYENYALENNPYCLHVPNDSTPVNVDEIVRFYDRTYAFGKKNVVEYIRKIAESRADISQTYNDVMKFILE